MQGQELACPRCRSTIQVPRAAAGYAAPNVPSGIMSQDATPFATVTEAPAASFSVVEHSEIVDHGPKKSRRNRPGPSVPLRVGIAVGIFAFFVALVTVLVFVARGPRTASADLASLIPFQSPEARADVSGSGRGVYDKALKSAVYINNPGMGTGSGVFVNFESKLVVTNFHVARRPPTVAAGNVVQRFDSSLALGDPTDAGKRHLKVFPVRLESGRSYRIDMESDVIDSYLMIFDATNRLVASDDDSGGNLNARVHFAPPISETYNIVASTFAGGLGPFALTVRDMSAREAEPFSKSLGYDSDEVFFPQFEDKLVLDKARYYAKSKANPEKYRAKVLAVDESRDLALMQLNVVPKGAQAIVFSKDSASPGERVHSIGNPGGSGALWVYTSGTARTAPYRRQWTSTSGSGLSLHHDAFIIETQSPTNPGDSGGPLLNDRAELIGLTQGNNAASNSISIFIDVSEIRAFISTNGYRP